MAPTGRILTVARKINPSDVWNPMNVVNWIEISVLFLGILCNTTGSQLRLNE
uniref:Uncharacterized protein n=1 Tax=Anguilla anguilla TaxID=7936 RepID=A0A0E9VRJ3_ANGAN